MYSRTSFPSPVSLPHSASWLPHQVEAHHPSGIKEILFGGGDTARRLLPDGTEEDVARAQLSAAIRLPRPAAPAN